MLTTAVLTSGVTSSRQTYTPLAGAGSTARSCSPQTVSATLQLGGVLGAGGTDGLVGRRGGQMDDAVESE